MKRSVTITPFFRWYDLWVGVYIDRDNGACYVCPLPMVGIKILYRRRVPIDTPDATAYHRTCKRPR